MRRHSRGFTIPHEVEPVTLDLNKIEETLVDFSLFCHSSYIGRLTCSVGTPSAVDILSRGFTIPYDTMPASPDYHKLEGLEKGISFFNRSNISVANSRLSSDYCSIPEIHHTFMKKIDKHYEHEKKSTFKQYV